eukprot:g1291.t1
MLRGATTAVLRHTENKISAKDLWKKHVVVVAATTKCTPFKLQIPKLNETTPLRTWLRDVNQCISNIHEQHHKDVGNCTASSSTKIAESSQRLLNTIQSIEKSGRTVRCIYAVGTTVAKKIVSNTDFGSRDIKVVTSRHPTFGLYSATDAFDARAGTFDLEKLKSLDDFKSNMVIAIKVAVQSIGLALMKDVTELDIFRTFNTLSICDASGGLIQNDDRISLPIKSQISLGVIDHLYAIESAILKENCLKSYVSKAVRARRAQRSQSWIRKTLTKSDENLVNYVIKSYLAKVGVPEDDVISHGDAIALLFKLRSDIIHCNKVGMITTKIPRQSMVPRCGPVTFHMTPTFWNKFGGPCRSSQCKIHSSLDLLKDSVKEALQKRYDDGSIGAEFATNGHNLILRIDRGTRKTIFTGVETETLSVLLDRNEKKVITEDEYEELQRHSVENADKYIARLKNELRRYGVDADDFGSISKSCVFAIGDPGVNKPLELKIFTDRQIKLADGTFRRASYENHNDFVDVRTWSRKEYDHRRGKSYNTRFRERRATMEQAEEDEEKFLLVEALSENEVRSAIRTEMEQEKKLPRRERDRLVFERQRNAKTLDDM